MIFLSHPLNAKTPLYGNSGTTSYDRTIYIKKGDTSNNMDLRLPAHAGTHIDAPFHFDPAGKNLSDYQADFWTCLHPFLLGKKATPKEILVWNNCSQCWS
jgi:arylformamidase